MKIIKTALEGAVIIEYEEKADVRGMKTVSFSEKDMADAGIAFKFAEEKIYRPEKAGTLYGIHFQNNPKPQAKIMYCLNGRGLDYAVDLRKSSPNYLKWVCVELSGENKRQFFIPKGFGHAFLSLEDNTVVAMRIDEPFDKALSRQIAWNDPETAIDFPVKAPILAPHDINAPLLSDSDINL